MFDRKYKRKIIGLMISIMALITFLPALTHAGEIMPDLDDDHYIVAHEGVFTSPMIREGLCEFDNEDNESGTGFVEDTIDSYEGDGDTGKLNNMINGLLRTIISPVVDVLFGLTCAGSGIDSGLSVVAQTLNTTTALNLTSNYIIMTLMSITQQFAYVMSIVAIFFYFIMYMTRYEEIQPQKFGIRLFIAMMAIYYLPYLLQDILNLNNVFVHYLINTDVQFAGTGSNVAMVIGEALHNFAASIASGGFFDSIFTIIIAIALFYFALQPIIKLILWWYLRMLRIFFYAVIGPFMMVAMALPQTAQMARKWLNGFIGETFSQSFLALGMVLTAFILGNLGDFSEMVNIGWLGQVLLVFAVLFFLADVPDIAKGFIGGIGGGGGEKAFSGFVGAGAASARGGARGFVAGAKGQKADTSKEKSGAGRAAAAVGGFAGIKSRRAEANAGGSALSKRVKAHSENRQSKKAEVEARSEHKRASDYAKYRDKEDAKTLFKGPNMLSDGKTKTEKRTERRERTGAHRDEAERLRGYDENKERSGENRNDVLGKRSQNNDGNDDDDPPGGGGGGGSEPPNPPGGGGLPPTGTDGPSNENDGSGKSSSGKVHNLSDHKSDDTKQGGNNSGGSANLKSSNIDKSGGSEQKNNGGGVINLNNTRLKGKNKNDEGSANTKVNKSTNNESNKEGNKNGNNPPQKNNSNKNPTNNEKHHSRNGVDSRDKNSSSNNGDQNSKKGNNGQNNQNNFAKRVPKGSKMSIDEVGKSPEEIKNAHKKPDKEKGTANDRNIERRKEKREQEKTEKAEIKKKEKKGENVKNEKAEVIDIRERLNKNKKDD